MFPKGMLLRTLILSICAALCAAALAQDIGGLDQARALLKEGKAGEAVEMLKLHLRTHTRGEEGQTTRRVLIDAMIADGSILQASNMSREYIERYPRADETHDVRYLLARLLEAQGNFSAATAAYKQYLELAPRTDRRRATRLYVAELLDNITRQDKGAILEYEKFVAEYPGTPDAADAAYRVATIYDNSLQDDKTAAERYVAWAEKYPKDERAADALRRAAWLYGPHSRNKANDWAKQIQVLTDYVTRYPDAADTAARYADMAWTYRHRLRQYQNAVDAYRSALKLKKSDEWARDMCHTYRSLQDQAARVDAFKAFLKDYPNSNHLHEMEQYLAYELRDAKRYHEEVRLLEELIAKYPDNCAVELWELGEAYRYLGQYADSLNAFIRLARSDFTYQGTNVDSRIILTAYQVSQAAETVKKVEDAATQAQEAAKKAAESQQAGAKRVEELKGELAKAKKTAETIESTVKETAAAAENRKGQLDRAAKAGYKKSQPATYKKIEEVYQKEVAAAKEAAETQTKARQDIKKYEGEIAKAEAERETLAEAAGKAADVAAKKREEATQAAEAAKKDLAMAGKAMQLAEQVLLERLKENPSPELLYHISWEFYHQRKKDYPKVVQYAKEIFAKYPEHSYADRHHAIAYLVSAYRQMNNDYEGAINDLRAFAKAGEMNAHRRDALAVVAQLLVDQGRHQQAVAHADSVRDATIDDEAHVWAGLQKVRGYGELGAVNDMLKSLAELALARQEPWHRNTHGNIDHERRGRAQPIVNKLEAKDALAADANGQLLYQRALAYHAMGSVGKALADYNAFVNTKGAAKGQVAEAKALIEQANILQNFDTLFGKGPHTRLPVRSQLRRANDYQNRRQGPQAVELYEAIAKQSEYHHDYCMREIPQSWERAGNWARAGQAWLNYAQKNPQDVGAATKTANVYIDQWKQKEYLEPVRKVISAAAEKFPENESVHYWAYRLYAGEKPQKMEVAQKHLESYERLNVQRKDDRGMYTAVSWRRDALRGERKYLEAAQVAEGYFFDAFGTDGYNAIYMLWYAHDDYRNAGNKEGIKRTAEALNKHHPTHDYAMYSANYMGHYGADWKRSAELLKAWTDRVGKNHPRYVEALHNYYEALWRGNIDKQKALEGYRTIFAEHPRSAQGARSAQMLVNYAKEQKDEKRALELTRQMVERCHPGHGEVRNAATELVQRYSAEETRDEQKLETVSRTQLMGRGEDWNIMYFANVLADSLRRRGRYLDANIVVMHNLNFARRNHPHPFGHTLAGARNLFEAERFEECAAVLKRLDELNQRPGRGEKEAATNLLTRALMKSGGGVEVIDQNLEHAGLLEGDIFLRSGEKDLAYRRFIENRGIFPKFHDKLSPDYIQLIAQRELMNSDAEEVVGMVRNYLIATKDKNQVPAAGKARLQNFIGECYQRLRQYELARDEFGTTINLYPDTEPAENARFRIAESYLAQGIYDKAEEYLGDLLKSEDRDTRIRATLMRGVALLQQDKRKEGMEEFRTALEMDPPQRIADELFVRLASALHDEGKLKQAYNLYLLVGSGGRSVKKLLEPGTRLRFVLKDRDLNIAGGQNSVPIEITTGRGDREIIKLEPSEAGTGMFVGDIATALGVPEPNNYVLEVKGGDEIRYAYESEWATRFVVKGEAAKARKITVVADGELMVSATEILSEEEQRARQQETGLFQRQERPSSRAFRNEYQIKPGNNVYIQVVDKDMSRTDEPDRIRAVATATSGDEVDFELVETGPHTGIFRAALPTSLRPADATASDETPGMPAINAIDGDPALAWRARADNKVPKWLTVDMKKLYPATRFTWRRGEKLENRAVLRYVLMASNQKKSWRPIAWFPDDVKILPGVEVMWEQNTYHTYYARRTLDRNGDTRSHWRGDPGRDEWIIDYDLGGEVDIAKTILRPHDDNQGVRRYELYVEKTTGKRPYQERTGNKAALDNWTKVYTGEAGDRLEADTAEFEDITARYVRVRVLQPWGGRPCIGEFEIYSDAQFEVTPVEGGVGADITFAPVECRYLRMQILEYTDDAPALADVRVYAGDRQVLPSGVDIHALAENTTLEMSPGDTVVVEYVDKVTTFGQAKTLRDDRLQATFYNATVAAIRHFFYDDERGQRHQIDHPVYRVNPGDRVIIEITDYDRDQTAEVDTIPFTVSTKSGEELTLTAQETEKYSGVFSKEVDIADRRMPNHLMARPGEIITVSYLDEENTDPGHPTPRVYELKSNEPTAGNIAVKASVEREGEDVSAGGPKLVSMAEPFVVKVTDPDRALDMGDKVEITLRTSGGVEQTMVGRLLKDEDLVNGVFTGEMPLQLGDKNSPDYIVPEITQIRRRPGEAAQLRVPVLNVKGTDIITGVYSDRQSPGATQAVARTDTARLVTDGKILITDSEYELEVKDLFVGGTLYLKVEDPCADVSDELDKVTVALASGTGDKEDVELTETLRHSGVFVRSLIIEHAKQPTVGDGRFESDFGSKLTATYMDTINTQSLNPVARVGEAEIVLGSDGIVKAFEKKYPSKDIAVETQLKMGESYFELGRKHAALAEKEKDEAYRKELLELSQKELNKGAEILRTLLHNYPDSQKLSDVAYLLAKLSEEQKHYHEAIESYSRLVRHWPESTRAIEAQYRIGICYEKLEQFDDACDAYVELAYNHPDSNLVGDSMIRIGLWFHKEKNYTDAAKVFSKFVETRRDHEAAEGAYFKWALSLHLAGQEEQGGDNYKQSGEIFGNFISEFPESKPDIKASSLFWAGESYFKARDFEKAFQMYKRCTWDYPESRWAKWARGRLTAREFENVE